MGSRGTVTFGAVGDIQFARSIGAAMAAEGPDWPFEAVRPVLARAELLFGNMEAVFIPADFPAAEVDPGGLICTVSGEVGAGALKRAGFDIMNLAANHVLDAGSIGLRHTRDCLEAAGIMAGGVGDDQAEARRLRVIEKNGLRFGFLCYAEDGNWTLGQENPGPAYYEVETVLADVARCRGEVDVLVVSIHADLEFMPTPSVPRLENSRRIARAGANIILQHHPHVPQGIEMVEGCLIAYSLGNFVFNSRTSGYMKVAAPRTSRSFVLLMEVDRSGVRRYERVPVEIAEPPTERPVPLAGRAAEEMRGYFEELDGHLRDPEFVQRVWRARAIEALAYVMRTVAKSDVDRVVNHEIGRLMCVAENRSWMTEVLAAGREQWRKRRAEADPYHRPEQRFRKA